MPNLTKILIQDHYYSIQECLNNPNNLYVFGDNDKRFGKKGQAIVRDCSNVFGIRTKRYPGISFEDYYNDSITDKLNIEQDCLNLKELYNMNVFDYIIFPKDGLGTGLSQLPTKSPQAFALLCNYLKIYFNLNLTEKGFV